MSVGDGQWASAEGLVPVQVTAIGINAGDGEPLMVLSAEAEQRSLLIAIGRSEALAIALHLDKVHPPRPLTHDLLVEILHTSGQRLVAVAVVSYQLGTFFGQLTFDDGRSLSCRPSDGVALAVRVGCPIYVAADVLAELGVDAADIRQGTEADLPEAELAQFRRFLDDVSPEDFASGEFGPPH